jgi:hypothetical protein
MQADGQGKRVVVFFNSFLLDQVLKVHVKLAAMTISLAKSFAFLIAVDLPAPPSTFTVFP